MRISPCPLIAVRHTLLALSLAALGACTGHTHSAATTPASAPVIPPAYAVVNVMPRFWRFLDAARDKDSAVTRTLFHDIVVADDSAVFAGFSGGPSDATLGRWLREVRPWLEAMRIVDARLERELPSYQESFTASFPAARWDSTSIYFMPWFFISDAGTGTLPDGRHILVFGIDDIARYRGPTANMGTLFHHELFHLVHARAHPEWNGPGRGPLYRTLWIEGLATYVSALLNPQAPLTDVVADSTTLARTRAQLGTLLREIRRQLDSTSSAVNRNYMSASPLRGDLPPRSGYYVGMLVAKRLAMHHSLAELVTLRDPALREEIDQALADLEKEHGT